MIVSRWGGLGQLLSGVGLSVIVGSVIEGRLDKPADAVRGRPVGVPSCP